MLRKDKQVINRSYLILSRQYILGRTKIAEHDVKFWFGSLLECLRWKYSTYRRENIRKTSEDCVLSKRKSKLLRKRVAVFGALSSNPPTSGARCMNLLCSESDHCFYSRLGASSVSREGSVLRPVSSSLLHINI